MRTNRTKAEDIIVESSIMYYSVLGVLNRRFSRTASKRFLSADMLASLSEDLVGWCQENIDDRKNFNKMKDKFMWSVIEDYSQLIGD